MASQKVASISWFGWQRQSVDVGFGLLIYPALIVLMTSLVLPVQVAGADSIDEAELFRMGDRVCQMVIGDEGRDMLGGVDYRASMNAADIDEAAFCGCVGTAFVFSAEDQSSRMEAEGEETGSGSVFAEILTENLDACLEPDSFFYSVALSESDFDLGVADNSDDASEQDECADGCQDGPVWADEWDNLQCQYVIDGGEGPAGFDRSYVEDWLNDSGVGVDSLCGCAARYMEDYEGANNDDLYWSQMVSVIDECQMSIWRRPLL